MSQLYKYVRDHFEFLQMYGYKSFYESQENCVSIVGKHNRLDIYFSIVEYELTCQFVDCKGYFTLQEALIYAEIKEFKGLYQMPRKEDLEKGLIYLSNAIKMLFNKIDVSDAENFKKIAQYRFDTHKKLLEDYYCKTDITKAEEYWKKGEYLNAQELYEKHISRLSKAQIKRLEYIRKNIYG